MLTILNKYNNKKMKTGTIDCNLVFLEIYEKEIFDKLVNNYKTFKKGSELAYSLTGYNSILELVEDSDKYTEVDNKNLAKFGDFFINKLHVSICVGDKTLTLVDKTFRLVPTTNFIHDEKNKLFKEL